MGKLKFRITESQKEKTILDKISEGKAQSIATSVLVWIKTHENHGIVMEVTQLNCYFSENSLSYCSIM